MHRHYLILDKTKVPYISYFSFPNITYIPLGRPRRRWEDNIRMDLQEVGLGYEDWIGLAQDRDRWRACECGEEPSGSIKRGEFLDQLQTS